MEFSQTRRLGKKIALIFAPDHTPDNSQMTLPLPFAKESTLLKTVGWVSAGLGAVALGLVVGNEIRQRYKFNRRTPYDAYGHSGDESQDMDFGLGI